MNAWRAVLIAVAGCAGCAGCAADRADGGAPGHRTGAPARPSAAAPAGAARAVDVTVAPGTPFAILGVERLAPPGERPGTGAFDVAYTVKPRIGAEARPDVRARVTCRIHELALAVEPAPEEFLSTADETRLTSYFRPDPFTAEPVACEISFRYRGATVGEACLRGGRIEDGGCGDGGPWAGEAGAGAAVEIGAAMTEVELAVRDGTASASAVLTVGAARTGHTAQVRCEDGGRVAAAREAAPLGALDGLAPGTSRYVQLTAELAERIGGPRSRCEVAIAAGGEVLARYCVAGRRSAAGGCAPALGAL